MKDLSLLIKPVSGRCNLRCAYCFYHDHALPGGDAGGTRMSLPLLGTLVSKAMQEASGSATFAFQGGEPTLAGLDFYREFVSLLKRNARPDLQVYLSLQTNGMLLDAEWADFLRDNRFLVGLSLDGDKDLHDGFRTTPAGKGTWRTVSGALRLLQERGVETNLLCVVTGPSARHAGRLYRYFKSLGCRYLQFIPCLDPLDAPHGGDSRYFLTPQRYGRFLCDLFDLWEADYLAGDYVSIRLFDDWVHALAGMPTGSCTTSGTCGGYFVVEADGSVYPCDFYVQENWRLGNITDASFAELEASPRSREFREESLQLPEACAACRFAPVCRGGCRRDRILHGEDPALGNLQCQAFQTFFQHALPGLTAIADRERAAARGALR